MCDRMGLFYTPLGLMWYTHRQYIINNTKWIYHLELARYPILEVYIRLFLQSIQPLIHAIYIVIISMFDTIWKRMLYVSRVIFISHHVLVIIIIFYKDICSMIIIISVFHTFQTMIRIAYVVFTSSELELKKTYYICSCHFHLWHIL